MAIPVHAVALVRKDDDSQTVEVPSALFHDLTSSYTITNAKVAMTVESFANGKFTGALNCYVDRFAGGGYFDIESQDITSINFPALSSMDTVTITFTDHHSLASVNFQNLSEITGNAILDIHGCDLLTAASFPLLATADQGNLWLFNNAVLAKINLPAIASIYQFRFDSNVALTSLSLPSLTTLPFNASFDGGGDTLLASVNLPSLASVGDAANIYLANCALTGACVNDLLVKVNAAKQGAGTINLSGGTSAAPSGSGITAATALTNAGWTVTTN